MSEAETITVFGQAYGVLSTDGVEFEIHGDGVCLMTFTLKDGQAVPGPGPVPPGIGAQTIMRIIDGFLEKTGRRNA